MPQKCTRKDHLVILMADDDQEDFILVREALGETEFSIELHWVENGEEAMDYMLRRGKYAEPLSAPRPDMILLDVKMPVKDGIDTLKEIKAHRDLRKIPVFMLTTSSRQDHVSKSYMHGASLFLLKPCTFKEMIKTMESLCEYYFNVVQLPERKVEEPVTHRPGKSTQNSFSSRFSHLEESRPSFSSESRKGGEAVFNGTKWGITA